VPVQVKITITRYQPFINKAGRNSLGNVPSHTINIKSSRFSWPRELLNKVLMLLIEENCYSHSPGSSLCGGAHQWMDRGSR